MDPEATAALTVAQYQLLEQLEQGESGTLYSARRMDRAGDDRTYAVRVLSARHRRHCRRLRQRGKWLRKVEHRALARFVESGLCERGPFAGRPYVVSEHVPGETLERHTEKNVVHPHTALRWAYELCEGLECLHDHPAVHGSLNPGNVIVAWDNRQGRVVRMRDAGISVDRALPYCSPEQLAGEATSAASDIYALGLILYELFAGVYPYEAPAKADARAWRAVHRRAVPARFEVAGVPQAMSEMVSGCLEKRPEKRPSAEQLLAALEKEVSGIGQPSYIGILGHRGAGKTCYLTAVYHVSRATPETEEILKDKHAELYVQGELPSATALSAYRLHFQISDGEKDYEIVTKDYGGELLEGRREERLHKEAAVDRDLLQEKRGEVYEFFRSARAMLIMVETMPARQDLEAQIDYRNEISSLVALISQVQDGKRRIHVPVALVLTKWDRMGGLTFDKDEEERRALLYIERTDWLGQLHEQLRIACPLLKVFPVCSFIGDKPSASNLQSFNILAPIVWAAEASEEAMLIQAQQAAASDECGAADKLALHWRLLHIERISQPKVREAVESGMQALSRKLLEDVNARVAADPREFAWGVSQYRQFLRTKGIQQAEREEAERLERRCQGRLRRRRRLALAWRCLALLFCLYGIWEFRDYCDVQQALFDFQQGRGQPSDLLARVHDYRWWTPVSVPRRRLEPAILRKVREIAQERLKQQSWTYARLVQEPIAAAPEEPESFGRNDLPILVAQIQAAEDMIRKHEERGEKLRELREIQGRWAEEFALELDRELGRLRVEPKLQELSQGCAGWEARWARLRKSRDMFEAWLPLAAERTGLEREDQNRRRQLQVLESRRFELAQTGGLLAAAREHRKAWQALEAKFRAYGEAHPQSPFLADAEQAMDASRKAGDSWSEPLRKLESLDDLRQTFQSLEKFCRLAEIARMMPADNERISDVQQKQDALQGVRKQCARVEKAVEEKALSYADTESCRRLCQQCLDLVERQELRCNYCFAQHELEGLAQDVQSRIRLYNADLSLAVLDARLRRILGWASELRGWMPGRDILAADSQKLFDRQERALREFAVYHLCQDLDQWHRSRGIAEMTPQDGDPRSAIREKQDKLQARLTQCRQLEEAIQARIPAQQIAPYQALHQECRKAIEAQQAMCRYFLAQHDLDEQVQWLRIETQTAGSLPLQGKLQRIVSLLEPLQQWRPAADVSGELQQKLLARRDAAARDFSIYRTCQQVERLYREGGIQTCSPQETDRLWEIENKQGQIRSFRARCLEIEEAVQARKIPAQTAFAYQALCRQIQGQLSEQEKRCCFFLCLGRLHKQILDCETEISAFDTPATLRKKEERLGEAWAKLRAMQFPASELLPGDLQKLSGKKGEADRAAAERRARIQDTVAGLEILERECRDSIDNWVRDVCARSSYRQSIQKAAELLESVRMWEYLYRDFGDKLESVRRNILAMRDRDFEDYRKVRELLRGNRFEGAVPQMAEYMKSKQHAGIMRQDVLRYYQSFSASVAVEMKVFADVGDTGGGSPDIRLSVAACSCKRGESWDSRTDFSEVYQETDKKSWPSQCFTLQMKLERGYALNIHVLELDPFEDDDYGKSSFSIQQLLNYRPVSHSHACGGDGSVSIALTPTSISPNVSLPAFPE